jgi:hypothetical protein
MPRRRYDPSLDEDGVIGHRAAPRRQPTLDSLPLFDQPKARAADPETSHQAAEEVRLSPKLGSARWRLLLAFADAGEAGLIDPEACERAGLSLQSEYATRCSELTNAGFLELTGEKRAWTTGQDRAVRRITQAGYKALG